MKRLSQQNLGMNTRILMKYWYLLRLLVDYLVPKKEFFNPFI